MKRFLQAFLVSILSLLLVVDLIFIIWATNVRLTALSPDWVEGQLTSLQVYAVAKDQVVDNLTKEMEKETELAEVSQRIPGLLDQTLSEDWMRQQVLTALYAFYPYLKGEANDFEFTISLLELRDSFKSAFAQSIYSDPPSELVAHPDLIPAFIAEANNEIDASVPDDYVVNKDRLGDAQPAIDTIRAGLSYLTLAYWVGIALAVVLGVLIWVVYRRLKPVTRSLGICALVAGASALVVVYLVPVFVPRFLGTADLPSPMTQDMVVGSIRAFMSPANIFAIALAAVGIGLIILSILWKERKPKKVTREA